MKILAVDDDPIILELLAEVLRVVGQTNLTLCNSASAALEAIEHASQPFDCLLLDIQMPYMDGIQLTSAVRKLPLYATCPIVMITAMSDRSYIDKAFAAGASDYITKPFEIGEVYARVRQIEAFVTTRRQQEDRNPVDMPRDVNSVVTRADMDSPLRLTDIDGFIEYLALENYLLQVSKISLFGMSSFGVVIPDIHRVFQCSSLFEYKSAIEDVAEAISDNLKPRNFFVSHVGGGDFVCVLSEDDAFDVTEFEAALNETLREMDLHFCDGRPLSLTPVVGNPLSLQLKTGKSVVNALVQSLEKAETLAMAPRIRQTAPTWSLKNIFGF
jgi:CheY-like chemotaxis protein